MATYEKQYSQTKLAWSTSTNATTPEAYVRIQGPRIWIELSRTTLGRLVGEIVHYHSIERDIKDDYGACISRRAGAVMVDLDELTEDVRARGLARVFAARGRELVGSPNGRRLIAGENLGVLIRADPELRPFADGPATPTPAG